MLTVLCTFPKYQFLDLFFFDCDACWDKLTAIGPKYGYFSKPTKSYLIVK